MGKSILKTGACLCGAVTVTVELDKEAFDVCHCGMCRTWGGGPAFTVDGKNTSFTGEEFISVFKSSEWAERGFCKRCGTHLFYQLKNADFRNLPLGLLKDTEGFEFHSQIYIDSKPKCYEFANKTAAMTEAQVIAKFTSTIE